MTLYEQIKEDHQFCTFTGETGRRAFCSCGESRHPWATREESHEMHFAEMFEQALRKQIANDIRAHATEIADTRLHAKGAIPYITGIHEAADIAEEGPLK